MRLVLIALTVVLALPAAAQRGRPFAEKGDFALVAQVSGLEVLRLNPALGGIGARYRVTDRTVLGASVALNAYDRDQSGDFDGSETGTVLDVTVWNENHFGRAGSRVSPFFGVGLGGGRGVNTRENVQTYETCVPDGVCQTLAFTQRQESRSTTYRGAAFVGAEVRVVSRLTLGAAYTLAVEHQSQTLATSTGQIGGPTSFPSLRENQTFGVSTGITDLHLSVYF